MRFRPIWLAHVMFLTVIGLGPRPAAAQRVASGIFDANGVKIHYVTAGQGEPVILIHGLESDALINWRLPGIFRDLAQDHRVLALDLRGHGGSDKPRDENAYGLELMEDVVRLLDNLKIAKAHVVGYSLGGMVAFKLIAKHPDRVLSASIGGMGWFRDGSSLQSLWEQMPAREGRGAPPELIHSVGRLALSRDELKAIKIPLEIVVGAKDPVKSLCVEPLSRVRQDWPVIEIADAGHFNCIVKKEYREELGAWLRKQTGR
jgi:pimeloyl-ACP methyl ester carboxylesterase